MKWFRLYTELRDDPKMKALSDNQFRHFINLLCTACEADQDGILPGCCRDLAWTLRTTQRAVEALLKRLVELNILQNGNGVYSFKNWEKRQFRSDNVSERVAKYRDKKQKNVTLQETLHVTPPEQSRAEQSIINLKVNCPHNEIVGLYHEVLPELSRVKVWTESRKKYLKQRWVEDKKRQSLDWWKKYFEYVRRCPLLMGENDRGWQADLEWLVMPKNFVKVIEGKYQK